MTRYQELREEYKTFEYKSYSYNEIGGFIHVKYNFSIPGLADFTPEWKFKSTSVDIYNKTFDSMIFSLGLVELVSYWKITCPPMVYIKAGYLDENQIKWWKDLYFNGLGEFYYTNGIEENEKEFMNIISMGKKIESDDAPNSLSHKALISVGGGKDSVVSMEIVKKMDIETNTYIINPRGATIKTSEAAGYNQPVIAERTLDQNMLRLNKEGYLNGHTPFSAIVSFSSIIAAYLNSASYVVLSNESSANESTVKGSTVNHQYSKSFKYEEDFVKYESEYIASGIKYFSLLRPLSEYQIAALFSNYKAYHKLFRSCNVGSKKDIWCGRCPKCLFVAIILSPFLSHKDICNIFGRDMLDDPDMLETLKKLIGVLDEKPFECVGSRDEINSALTKTIENMRLKGERLPQLLVYYENSSLYNEYRDKENNYLKFYDNRNLIPKEFEQALKEELLRLC